MTNDERQNIANLLDQIEIAIGEVAPRQEPNASPIAAIIQAVNGLRSVLGVIRSSH